MPWAAISFGDYRLRRKLRSDYKVEVLPALVILDPQGEPVKLDACENVVGDPLGLHFPWAVSNNPM